MIEKMIDFVTGYVQQAIDWFHSPAGHQFFASSIGLLLLLAVYYLFFDDSPTGG